ncbi:MAG TPA: CerR family C-terminal domain-containing protein [Desulfovibrio sp.]|jgi:AcrR family transcriptional regulator|uniref:CerR family C-terminal domain-containing protein n=1 Tax=Desulfovibrio TaxID=872 RepID=UPI002A3747C8|nr:CerR family C-terminal domain-containing protein [Desulfovibrio sp.]MDY0305677.1 CerR family C-terminal domain-containing protein [Desulfovibrionaceae bacterium]HMM39107.1 CerR family C-terminal domain-containing protein [Desulfovibrio sp.]
MTQDGTRQRLLRAAGEIISRKGFRAATVREICARAEANVASVKYHFGNKRRLYEEVLQAAFEESIRDHPPDPGPDFPPAERLRAFIRSFVFRLHGSGRGSWFGMLLTREMYEPTEALDQLVQRAIRPMSKLLQERVRELGGPGLDDRAVLFCGLSVAAQCQHFFRSSEVVRRIHPALRFDRQGLEELADHILAFSLAAIENYRRADSAGGRS